MNEIIEYLREDYSRTSFLATGVLFWGYMLYEGVRIKLTNRRNRLEGIITEEPIFSKE